ncbi:MAG: GGDEF domain-containing protein [Betaproteobacteria bacterium]|nr:GGDEF domain-containing protein [Betaproteobacteria bacterium]
MVLLTARQVLVRISVIILTTEFLIMLVLGAFSDSLNTYVAAALDVVILAAVASPLIYLWVIRSFVVARDDALAEVRALALTDPLTQMPNRRMLSLHLEKFISGSARHRVHGALLLIDLDGFKVINDTDGHDAGDAVLIEVAKRIQSITREADVAARLGGDEFVVLIDRLEIDREASRAQALLLAERLIQIINAPIEYAGKSLKVGASIGVRMLGSNLAKTQTLMSSMASGVISDADAAMYGAKRAGKGCAAVFDDLAA